ncbi:hypothetical protein HPB52_021590 [Rhipicephalus sanguineus]|uniref:Uncharacterized protein n=1 Tax=Rhipicephalus sanguineus TaxID=34632 RepID=A0A9D4Q8A1_RHISA|nr:hypothetical protein HPB52_021590 [Rhipicephalus sanguineus]
MERAKNKRESRRSQSTGIVNEVNQLVQSDQFKLSTLHVLHGRLKAVQTELAALNAELETFLTDEQVAEDYDSVMEYEDAATSALALLERHMNRLKVSSPASTAHPPATTTREDPPATSEREPMRPQPNTACRRRTYGEQCKIAGSEARANVDICDALYASLPDRMRAEIEGHGDASRF